MSDRACEYFDTIKDVPMSTCPHEIALRENKEGLACDHWMNNYDPSDVFACCRNNGEPYKDEYTIDMFNNKLSQ